MAKSTMTLAGAPGEVHEYGYTARNTETGKKVTGTAKATNKNVVSSALLDRGMIPLKVKGGPSEGAGLNTEITVRKVAKHRDLVITTRLLATMFEAGLSPLAALDFAAKDCEDEILKNALVEIRMQVANGVPLSEAMRSQPAFPPTIANFIAAGETSGDVKDALERVATQYDWEDKMRAKVKKAMMYPVVVAIISGIIFAGMMLFLVPKFAESFADLAPGSQLPFLTRVVVAASNILKYALPIAAVTLIPTWIWYKRVKDKPEIRAVMDPFKMSLPVFGNLFHKIALAKFCRNLSGMLVAGVERLEALQITAETVGNVKMEEAIWKAHAAQRNGEPLVEPLREEELFPPLVIQMVEVGEESGQTGMMLGRAADIYDRDVDTITDNMAELIQPLFMVVIGGMIAVIVIAIYLPYMSMMSMVG